MQIISHLDYNCCIFCYTIKVNSFTISVRHNSGLENRTVYQHIGSNTSTRFQNYEMSLTGNNLNSYSNISIHLDFSNCTHDLLRYRSKWDRVYTSHASTKRFANLFGFEYFVFSSRRLRMSAIRSSFLVMTVRYLQN